MIAPFSTDNYTSTDSVKSLIRYLSPADVLAFKSGKRAYYYAGYIVAHEHNSQQMTFYCGYAVYTFGDLVIHDCPTL